MNNIPGVCYPIDQNVTGHLCQFPALADRIRLSGSDRSNLEIIRLLGNVHYGHIRNMLEFLDRSAPVAASLVDEVLKQTDPMEFGGRLAELYLFCHIAHHLPGRVKLANEPRSKKCPDMIVGADDLDVAIEVYGPINLFGFQLVTNYAVRILKYLEIDLGYVLRVEIEPGTKHDRFFAYQFQSEKEIRPWLCAFAEAVTAWLSKPSPQPRFQQKGSSASGWKLSVFIEELHHDRSLREISQRTAGRSDDPRLHFEIGMAEATADGWWGRSVGKKMAKRQAGAAPSEGLLRMLVIDFARLDTSFPDFICWPHIAERIDASIHLLAEKIGAELPYDVVLPARLSLSCCFGSPVWLEEIGIGKRQDFFDRAGLTVPCKTQEMGDFDWPSILAE